MSRQLMRQKCPRRPLALWPMLQRKINRLCTKALNDKNPVKATRFLTINNSQPALVERLVRHMLLPREHLPQIKINSSDFPIIAAVSVASRKPRSRVVNMSRPILAPASAAQSTLRPIVRQNDRFSGPCGVASGWVSFLLDFLDTLWHPQSSRNWLECLEVTTTRMSNSWSTR